MAALPTTAPTLPIAPAIRWRFRAPGRSAVRGPVRHHSIGATRLISRESVVELRVVTVRVEQRLCVIRLLQHSVGHRLVEPAVVGPSGEHEHPARNSDGHHVPANSFTSG